METDNSQLTDTVGFYSKLHPDIFGADLTEAADTSAVNTPRSTIMGGKLADDTSFAQLSVAHGGGGSYIYTHIYICIYVYIYIYIYICMFVYVCMSRLSARGTLAPREMPVHFGTHAPRGRGDFSEGAYQVSHRGSLRSTAQGISDL